MKRNGFTLVELLAVIAIIAILATLGTRIVRSARINAKKAQAGVEMQSIETAVKSYMNRFGKLPLKPEEQGLPEAEVDEVSSRETIQMLTGKNPAGMVFLETPVAGVGEPAGTFLDPWGEQYLVFLDSDYDGKVDVEVDGWKETVPRKVAIVAVGLYLLDEASNTNELIRSWQ